MREKEYKLNYGLISKYRALLMGTAILFIMFCHMDVSQGHNGVPTTSLARALHIFTVGVDMFLFLSGVGLYYSYTKRTQAYGEFEKKRLIRIVPSYLVIGGVTYLLYDIFIKRLGVGKFLKDLLFISWFREGTTRYWYVLAIVVFYLLFPTLYRFIHGGKNGLQKTVLFSLCCWTLVELVREIVPYVNAFRVALARLPIFIIGIYFGKLAYKKTPINRRTAIFLLLCGYALFLSLKTPVMKSVASYLHYSVRALLGLSIIITIIILMEIIEKRASIFYNVIMRMLGWFGGLTLELYLLHQSYMILFESPYKQTTYPIAAFVLPTLTAGVICLVRRKRKVCKRYE